MTWLAITFFILMLVIGGGVLFWLTAVIEEIEKKGSPNEHLDFYDENE